MFHFNLPAHLFLDFVVIPLEGSIEQYLVFDSYHRQFNSVKSLKVNNSVLSENHLAFCFGCVYIVLIFGIVDVRNPW